MKRETFLKTLLALPLMSYVPKKTIKKNKVIEFTPEILKKNNFGLFIINDKADVVKNSDYAATVSWKLGWSSGSLLNGRYGKINFLTDGWFHPMGNNYEEVCNYLNNNPYNDKYRIMTKEELQYIIENRTNSSQLFYE